MSRQFGGRVVTTALFRENRARRERLFFKILDALRRVGMKFQIFVDQSLGAFDEELRFKKRPSCASTPASCKNARGPTDSPRLLRLRRISRNTHARMERRDQDAKRIGVRILVVTS